MLLIRTIIWKKKVFRRLILVLNSGRKDLLGPGNKNCRRNRLQFCFLLIPWTLIVYNGTYRQKNVYSTVQYCSIKECYFVIRYHAKIEKCEKSFKTALVPSSVENLTRPNQNPEMVFFNFQRFLGTDSASLCNLAGAGTITLHCIPAEDLLPQRKHT